MSPNIFIAESLTGAVKSSLKRVDRLNGAAVNNATSEWTDDYAFDEYIQDYFSFKNKNYVKKQYLIKKINSYVCDALNVKKHHLITSNVFTEINDVSGSCPDVELFLMGVPENMISFNEPMKKITQNIFFYMGESSGNCNKLDMMGIIIYCLIKNLHNVSFNLYGVHNVNHDVYNMVTFYKQSCPTLYPQLQMVLTNLKGFHRRIMFAIEEGLSTDVRNKNGFYNQRGYGAPESFISDQHVYDIFKIKPDIFLNKDLLFDNNIEESCEKIIETIFKD